MESSNCTHGDLRLNLSQYNVMVEYKGELSVRIYENYSFLFSSFIIIDRSNGVHTRKIYTILSEVFRIWTEPQIVQKKKNNWTLYTKWWMAKFTFSTKVRKLKELKNVLFCWLVCAAGWLFSVKTFYQQPNKSTTFFFELR